MDVSSKKTWESAQRNNRAAKRNKGAGEGRSRTPEKQPEQERHTVLSGPKR